MHCDANNQPEIKIICFQIFKGNFDRNTEVKRILRSGAAGRGLRIFPRDVHGSCCMRVELFGEAMLISNRFHVI